MSIQAEAILSALIDSTKDLIWSVDLDGRLTAFNRAWQQLCDETHGVLPAVGMRLEDFLPPEHAAFWLSLWERARTDGSVRIEQRLPDGRTVELSINPIVADGNVMGFPSSVRTLRDGRRTKKLFRKRRRSITPSSMGRWKGCSSYRPRADPWR